jgi:hypothetical protein
LGGWRRRARRWITCGAQFPEQLRQFQQRRPTQYLLKDYALRIEGLRLAGLPEVRDRAPGTSKVGHGRTCQFDPDHANGRHQREAGSSLALQQRPFWRSAS